MIPLPQFPHEPQQGCPPVWKGSVNSGAPHPLTFAHSGGDIVWRDFNRLSISQALALRNIIRDDLINGCFSGGGVSGALTLLLEIQTSINAARRWRQCQGAA